MSGLLFWAYASIGNVISPKTKPGNNTHKANMRHCGLKAYKGL